MTHFGNGQRKHGAGSCIADRFRRRDAGSSTDPGQAGLHEHDQRDVAIPGGEAPHFVILQPDRFAGLETFLDFPSLPDRLNHLDQGRTQWREDKVVGLLARIVHTSADQQKVSTIIGAPMRAAASRPNRTVVAPWSPDSSKAAANPPLGKRKLRPQPPSCV
jgi:hypothetical protein